MYEWMKSCDLTTQIICSAELEVRMNMNGGLDVGRRGRGLPKNLSDGTQELVWRNWDKLGLQTAENNRSQPNLR
jgi:hypothetical protein